MSNLLNEYILGEKMKKTGNSLKKEEVYRLANEVKCFLRILEGTAIEVKDKSKLYEIETQKVKLEQMLIEFEPSIYEEYSIKTKYAYQKMIKSKKEYDRVVKEKCFNEVIEDRKNNYEENVKNYEALKKYRNQLKEALQNI